jgi:intracellular sulfur oxidation DsrE/DsrF family protein
MGRTEQADGGAVHGASADASGFAGVIRKLAGAGVNTLVPANSLRALSFDSDSIKTFVAVIGSPSCWSGTRRPVRSPRMCLRDWTT